MIKKNSRVHIYRNKNLRSYSANAFAVSAMLLVISVIGFGQTPAAALHGEVVDENDARISGAHVHMRSRTGEQRSTTSDEKGVFEFRNLPPGPYLIEARKDGFATLASDKILIERGKTRYLELKLKVAAVSENIVVTASGTAQRADRPDRHRESGRTAGALRRRLGAWPRRPVAR